MGERVRVGEEQVARMRLLGGGVERRSRSLVRGSGLAAAEELADHPVCVLAVLHGGLETAVLAAVGEAIAGCLVVSNVRKGRASEAHCS